MKKDIFIPSKYQIALFSEITDTRNHILVQAVAGSGKTTSIVRSLELLPKNKDIIFLAFNKSIIKELKEKVPKNVTVSTLHSFGMQTLYRHYGGEIKFVEDKMFYLAIKLSKDWVIPSDEKNHFVYCNRIRQLCDIMRQCMITEDEDAIYQLSLKYNIDVFANEIVHAMEVVRVADKNFDQVDFVDMIYQLARRNLKTKRYDYVFVDEVQDLNIAQQTIVKKLLKPGIGRFIGVGDPFQSIYGFAGADFESFDKMKKLFPNMSEMPLSMCYRCGIEIVKHASDIVPHIEFNPKQEKGVVRYDGRFEEIESGDWILCRNTKPLVFAFIELLRQGKKANIKGKEIGANLVLMIKKSKKKDLSTLIKYLKVDRVKIKEKLIKKGVKRVNEHEKVIQFTEKIEIIQILGKVVGNSVSALIKYIDELFLDEEIPGITLSTIHKSKGLEADRIFVICKELLPSPFATQPHEIIQEMNLDYVMRTRAKKELIYVPLHHFNPKLVEQEQDIHDDF